MIELKKCSPAGSTDRCFVRMFICLTWLFLCIGPVLLIQACSQDRLEIIKLENAKIDLEVTPGLGGRVLSFSLKGYENLLKIGDAVKDRPNPEVSAEAENIGYLGHINWIGPQTRWWTQQGVNMQRFAAQAPWPPDPFLVFAKNAVLDRSPNKLVLEGVESPVSGIQLKKSFLLPDKNQAKVQLDVTATNIRKEKVSWDLWFNTRVLPTTKVYVPVASHDDVRVESFLNEITGPVEYSLENGYLTLEMNPPPNGMVKRQGKLFIQPSKGWMAGFSNKQVFIISFPLQPKESIHPEQGQVELYLSYQPDDLQESLIEMEVHSPYLTLLPGQSMQASEKWSVIPYDGPDTRNAQVDFLKKYFSNPVMAKGVF